MRNRFLYALLLFTGFAATSQTTSLSLNDAINTALNNSNAAALANARVETRGFETQSVKNNRYPDLKVSGQYLRLANADINLRSNNNEPADPDAEPASSPKVNELALGQANINMPIFSGFRLKHSIAASENLLKAEEAGAVHTKEETAMQVVRYYADLYKVQQSVALYNESLKSSQQRVTDFTAMEKNGIIARNDLLKAQLQVSKVQLSLDEAEKNVRLINFYLVSLLKLPASTQIVVTPENIDQNVFNTLVRSESEALSGRKDLEAMHYQQEAGNENIKVAKSGYFPSLSLVGGYTALELQNVVTVRNAMNVGVGLSYNLSSILKNGAEVRAAKSRAQELEHQQAILTDEIRAQVMQSRENYELSLKQDQLYAEAVGQANENYRIVKDKYDNGLSDTSDLLEADVEQLSANINQAYAKANVVLKYYELLEATGQLTETVKPANK